MNIKEYINKKADVILIATAVSAVAVFIGAAWMMFNRDKQSSAVNNVPYINSDNNGDNTKDNNVATSTEWRCLEENEIAEYAIKKGTHKWLGIPEYPLTIFVKKKGTNEKIFSFQIDDIRKTSRSVEVCKCGVYVVKLFNYDFQKAKKKLGYRSELWKYDYGSNGEMIILMSEKPDEFISYYNSSFRVDPLERYVVLERGYLYKDDYALVIKDLETKEDVFTLLHSELPKKDLKLQGLFDFREWTKDGRYFWGAISAGAVVPGFFRIDTEAWEYELFADLPEWIGGGDRLNIETGWVTYHTDMVWTGIHDATEAIKQERREQGIGTTLYIYNLFTKEKRFIYKTEEPIWFTKPEWLSDTELEYELPSGEKNIYQIE